jgi:hypothetical protein
MRVYIYTQLITITYIHIYTYHFPGISCDMSHQQHGFNLSISVGTISMNSENDLRDHGPMVWNGIPIFGDKPTHMIPYG